MIKLFIFDMGGVLVRNNNILPEAAGLLGLSYDEIIGYVEDDIIPLMEGLLSAEGFWKNFSSRSGIAVNREFWGELYNPVIDNSTRKLITEIRDSYRVVCGTNTLAQHYDVHENNGDFSNFDRVYASHIMKIAKPKPEFYQRILDQEGVSPSETVFTDDFAENIETAAGLGINSFLFKDAALLENDLDNAGIKIRSIPQIK